MYWTPTIHKYHNTTASECLYEWVVVLFIQMICLKAQIHSEVTVNESLNQSFNQFVQNVFIIRNTTSLAGFGIAWYHATLAILPSKDMLDILRTVFAFSSPPIVFMRNSINHSFNWFIQKLWIIQVVIVQVKLDITYHLLVKCKVLHIILCRE